MNKKVWFVILAVLSVLSSFGLFHIINTYLGVNDDNPVEQAVEEVIEEGTGVTIDLTPSQDKQ